MRNRFGFFSGRLDFLQGRNRNIHGDIRFVFAATIGITPTLSRHDDDDDADRKFRFVQIGVFGLGVCMVCLFCIGRCFVFVCRQEKCRAAAVDCQILLFFCCEKVSKKVPTTAVSSSSVVFFVRGLRLCSKMQKDAAFSKRK